MASHAHRHLPSRNGEEPNGEHLLDGIFHTSTYVFAALGLSILWRYSQQNHIRRSSKLLPDTFLMGFGIFNLVEELISHKLLGLHHVNKTVPRERWIYWGMGFLIRGAAMLGGSWLLLKRG